MPYANNGELTLVIFLSTAFRRFFLKNRSHYRYYSCSALITREGHRDNRLLALTLKKDNLVINTRLRCIDMT